MAIYNRARQTSIKMIAKYGLKYDVIRKGSISVANGKEIVTTTDSQFTTTGIRIEYKPHEIDGTSIQTGDIKMVFMPDVELKINDIVVIDSEKYIIK